MAFDPSTLPPVIGHRGARNHAPENTLAGLRVAASQGVRWVEVDVKLTRDGVPILIHDEDLDRTTDGHGPVMEQDLAAIRRLDAGGWFGPAFRGERIPTLEEALALMVELSLGVNLEIKPCPGREEETARVALDLARRLWPAHMPVPLISSFAAASLEAGRPVVPDWPVGYLMEEPAPDWQAIVDRLNAATINVDAKRQTEASVKAYRASGRPVMAYTVNDGAEARRLFAWGVASVFTDTPPEIFAAIGA